MFPPDRPFFPLLRTRTAPFRDRPILPFFRILPLDVSSSNLLKNTLSSSFGFFFDPLLKNRYVCHPPQHNLLPPPRLSFFPPCWNERPKGAPQNVVPPNPGPCSVTKPRPPFSPKGKSSLLFAEQFARSCSSLPPPVGGDGSA